MMQHFRRSPVGKRRLPGAYQPTGKLSSLVGSNASGTWTLQILNKSQNTSGVLVNWSLNITPQITVTPVNPVNGTTSTFQIGFPIQQLSGTYTIQLGPDILDTFGQGSDTTQSAGLDVLRGQQQNGPTTTVLYTASDNLPKTIPAPSLTGPGVVSSTIVGARQLHRSGRHHIRQELAGYGCRSTSHTRMTPISPRRFTMIWANLARSQFHCSVALGMASLPRISPIRYSMIMRRLRSRTVLRSFFATFNPQMPLTAFQGLDAKGTWTLVVTNATSGSGLVGSLNGWSLSFQKPLPTTGLGEHGSDNVSD